MVVELWDYEHGKVQVKSEIKKKKSFIEELSANQTLTESGTAIKKTL